MSNIFVVIVCGGEYSDRMWTGLNNKWSEILTVIVALFLMVIGAIGFAGYMFK